MAAYGDDGTQNIDGLHFEMTDAFLESNYGRAKRPPVDGSKRTPQKDEGQDVRPRQDRGVDQVGAETRRTCLAVRRCGVINRLLWFQEVIQRFTKRLVHCCKSFLPVLS